MITTLSRSQTLASLPKCCLKMPMVPGPQTSWVISTSTSVQTLSPARTASRLAWRARIFSVKVIGVIGSGSRTIVLMLTSYQMTGRVTAARPWKQSEGPSRQRLGPLAAERALSFGRSRLAISFVGALALERNRFVFVPWRMPRGIVDPHHQGIAREGRGAVAAGTGHLVEEPSVAVERGG